MKTTNKGKTANTGKTASTGTILALDQGTTNSKALLFNSEGRVVARGSRPLKTSSPQPGWAEQDPEEIWTSIAASAADCLQGQAAEEVRAIGISNQRETILIWDARTGRPVSPAVVWQCRRSAGLCAQLAAQGLEPLLRAKTGLGIDPLFSASKIGWMLDNIPGVRQRAERGELRCGTVDSWLISNLTGNRRHICDRGNASRTQLLNLETGEWDDELLAIFRIPRALLPSIAGSSGILGETAALPFLPPCIPITSALGDSHAALAGHAIFKPHAVKATYGTGSSLMTLTPGRPGASPELSATIAWSRSQTSQYALEGNITMTGSAVEWCGRFLGLADPVEDLARLAAQTPSSNGVFFVPAMCGLGSPYWDSGARGLICGLERGSTAAHLARAALEAIAFQVRDVFAAMERAAGSRLDALHADGGATRNSELMQIQADLLGRPVLRSNTAELSAVGAAYLAGNAFGFWHAPSEMAAMNSVPDRFEPRLDASVREDSYDGWKAAVRRALQQGSKDRLASEL